MKPKLIIFASGTKTGGGSGFENLVRSTRDGELNAEIVAVVSNHEHGGVRERADRLGIAFVHFPGPWITENYREIVERSSAEWVALSGWLKLASGLDPRKTFNIHPGPVPEFGGKGMHGHHVHEAVMQAYREGRIKESAVSMHFVTTKYDEGPVFFRMPVRILDTDTPETLGARVNAAEHRWQAKITDLVIHGKIGWNGTDPRSLWTPDDYSFKPRST
ncbi:MAG: hypothetical protein A3B31_03065 [Candidatus Komeilibacteria bacterium RIFCSPLOWO2_01_FULL_53_11]|uniref:phosphoribosylglycinamide formyltransferase 1 n=1 Tax=Candidatus Komeilibacteria bacterium RIFCSPLOWO2_01_FULL_53_11 TaxID=1798552 RepID=A0A1G2BRU7_9BACT|nr:MAG: hypothetical protein A3B31_03065 [Candidatus Komeilibacteria bacterium RIFCSPLOWO2_01_FULL_53_11]